MFNISVDSQKLTSSAYTEDMDKLLIKSEVVEGYLQSNKEFMNDDSKENTERTERTNEYSKLQMNIQISQQFDQNFSTFVTDNWIDKYKIIQ